MIAAIHKFIFANIRHGSLMSNDEKLVAASKVVASLMFVDVLIQNLVLTASVNCKLSERGAILRVYLQRTGPSFP